MNTGLEWLKMSSEQYDDKQMSVINNQVPVSRLDPWLDTM